MTIWAAQVDAADRFIIADKLVPLSELWTAIIERPLEVAERYESVWSGQNLEGSDYFNHVRARYNACKEPVGLLYLIWRCVKNAVRFNRHGNCTQSVDKRRLGMRPARMRAQLIATSNLLRGRTEVRSGDWRQTTSDATSSDFVYLDPPYLGTTVGRDKRYAEQLPQADLIRGLQSMLRRDLRFALSYDGMTGGKSYGQPLPDELGLTQLLLHAGRSSQATLVGRSEETIESLYTSPGLAEPTTAIIRRPVLQASLEFVRTN